MWWGTLAPLIGLFVFERLMVRRGARRLRQRGAAMYDDHLVPTSPGDHPDVDHRFYDETEARLGGEGFAKVADLEFAGSRRNNPTTHTFLRMMADADGTTAAIYHFRTRGLVPLHHDSRVFECETELDDGRFLCTSIAANAGKLAVHPDIHREFLDASTTVASLAARHRARVRDYLAQHPGTHIREIRTIDDLVASHRRQTAIKKAFRASLGNAPTREELRAIGGPALGGTADALADEIDRQRSAERPPSTPD